MIGAKFKKNGSRDFDHTPFKGDFSPYAGTWLDVAYPSTKVDHISFSRSRDMVGACQNLNDSRAPFEGYFVIFGLGLATINLPTKFVKSPSPSTTKTWKGTQNVKNVENWVVWCSLELLKVIKNSAIW